MSFNTKCILKLFQQRWFLNIREIEKANLSLVLAVHYNLSPCNPWISYLSHHVYFQPWPFPPVTSWPSTMPGTWLQPWTPHYRRGDKIRKHLLEIQMTVELMECSQTLQSYCLINIDKLNIYYINLNYIIHAPLLKYRRLKDLILQVIKFVHAAGSENPCWKQFIFIISTLCLSKKCRLNTSQVKINANIKI